MERRGFLGRLGLVAVGLLAACKEALSPQSAGTLLPNRPLWTGDPLVPANDAAREYEAAGGLRPVVTQQQVGWATCAEQCRKWCPAHGCTFNQCCTWYYDANLNCICGPTWCCDGTPK